MSGAKFGSFSPCGEGKGVRSWNLGEIKGLLCERHMSRLGLILFWLKPAQSTSFALSSLSSPLSSLLSSPDGGWVGDCSVSSSLFACVSATWGCGERICRQTLRLHILYPQGILPVPWSNLTPYTICQQETNHYQLDVPEVWQMLAMNCNEGTMLKSRQVAQIKSGRLKEKTKLKSKVCSLGIIKARTVDC